MRPQSSNPVIAALAIALCATGAAFAQSPAPAPTAAPAPSSSPAPAPVPESESEAAEREEAERRAEERRREQADRDRERADRAREASERARETAERNRQRAEERAIEQRERESRRAQERILRDRSRRAAEAARDAAGAALSKNRSDISAAVKAAVEAARVAGVALSAESIRAAIEGAESVNSREFMEDVRSAAEEATEAALAALDAGTYSYTYSYVPGVPAPLAPLAPQPPTPPVPARAPKAPKPPKPPKPPAIGCAGCSASEIEAMEEAMEEAEDLYDEAMDSIDDEDWTDAISSLDQLMKLKIKDRVDAALYWKAYAQGKTSRSAAALATLTQLQKSYPQSAWAREARALEAELRGRSGQAAPVIAETQDTDLKLMALQALADSDPTEAIPVLQKLIASPTESRKVRERALFVLANSGPKGVDALAGAARGQAGPDMQRKAVEYLGVFGGTEARRVLGELYGANTDPATRRQILNAFMVAGDKTRVLSAAKTEKDPKLRGEATRLLGVMGAMTELREMYRGAAGVDEKKAILQALFIGGASDAISDAARTETDPGVREAAVHHLGLMGRRTQETLSALYKSEASETVKKQILQAFFLQGNATKLVEIARAETNPGLKREAVRLLALTNSKEAKPFLLELLKQDDGGSR